MRRNFLWMTVMVALIILAVGCGNNVEQEIDSDTKQQTEELGEELVQSENVIQTEGNGRNLIVYFSWSGNTEAVAQEIQNQTGADIFQIEPLEPYIDDYNEMLDIAQEEQQQNARPAIEGTIDNFQDYDTIYLGYPNWWGDMPMIIYRFLDDYDLSGKTIAPFVTSGGSGFSGSIDTIQEMEPDAILVKGLALGSDEAHNCAEKVTKWINEIQAE